MAAVNNNNSLQNEVEMARLISSKEIEFVHVEIADTSGCSRGLLVNAPYFLKSYKKGYTKTQSLFAFTANNDIVPGSGYLDEISYRNFLFLPDMSTFKVTPWLEKTASVLVDSHPVGEPNTSHPASTRNICKRQLEKLAKHGFSFFSASEYEFYLLDPETKQPAAGSGNFMSTQAQKKFTPFCNELIRQMEEIGLNPEFVHAEYGCSQIEAPIAASIGITGSDNAFREKNLVKDIAAKHSYQATFMTKPWANGLGSSNHFNHSLWANGKNLFYDPNGEYGLSKIARHWLAGLQYHTDSLLCLACPTPNCIQRTNSGGFAPTTNAWGFDNRSLTYRIKDAGTSNVYFEMRLGAAAANPYLVTAGCIVAGLDGIKRELPLLGKPYEGEVTADKNLPDYIKKTPQSLSASIDCFEKNETFVEAFGAEFVKLYCAMKRFEDKKADEQREQGNEFKWYMDYYGEYI